MRLNPAPRYVEQRQLEIEGGTWDTEVVWGVRLDPARIQLVSVPLPGSGHRHGDVVLHDGEPHGSRQLGDEEVAVFDEIELWERSPRPTVSVGVQTPAEEDVEELLRDLEETGLAGEDWTASVRMLCQACSEGSPGCHSHPVEADGEERRLGVSGDPEDVDRVLSAWRDRAPGRSATEVVVELE